MSILHRNKGPDSAPFKAGKAAVCGFRHRGWRQLVSIHLRAQASKENSFSLHVIMDFYVVTAVTVILRGLRCRIFSCRRGRLHLAIGHRQYPCISPSLFVYQAISWLCEPKLNDWKLGIFKTDKSINDV